MHAPGQSAEVLMRVAADTRNEGDPATAVQLYRRIHEMKPDDPKPLAELGSTLLQLKAYTESARAYRSAIDMAPNDPELHRGLATVLLALNQPAAALPELEQAKGENGGDARLYNSLGVAHDLIGRHDLAQKDYREAMRLAPKNRGIKNNYGLSLALSGDYAAAAAALGEIADNVDSPARYRLNLALVYGLAGDDRKAGDIARTALDETAVRSNLAYYALLRGMDDKARAAAIMGGQIQGPIALKDPPPEHSAPPSDPAAAATPAVAAAPVAPVTQAALPAPAALAKSDKPAEKTATASAAAPEPDATAAASTQPASIVPASAASASAPAVTTDAAAAASDPVKLTRTEPDSKEASDAAPAAAAPASAPAPVAEMAPVPDPTPAPKTAAAGPAPASGDFVVQLGSFASEANARKLAEQLNGKGYTVAVAHHRDHGGRNWYAVRAGGFASAEEAAAAAQHMRQSEQLPAVVVRLRGSAQA